MIYFDCLGHSLNIGDIVSIDTTFKGNYVSVYGTIKSIINKEDDDYSFIINPNIGYKSVIAEVKLKKEYKVKSNKIYKCIVK